MSHPTPHESFKTEEDHVPFWRIMGMSVVSLAVFALFILWSTKIQYDVAGTLVESGNSPMPADVYKPEVGIVDQVLFEKQAVAAQTQEAQRKRLSSYGFVDRAKGIVHIPIERAMDELAGGRP
jgi:hypothetical protein